MVGKRLRIPVLLWLRLVRDLRRRGAGHRESGAFILGIRGKASDIARTYICYDDLDPEALDRGIVVIHGTGYAALWVHCRNRGLEVLADVHTHPGELPRQSETDRLNPMISEAGHLAFILPRFGLTRRWTFQEVALYEYINDYRWREWTEPTRKDRVKLVWW